MTTRVTFFSDDVLLEGELNLQQTEMGAVIAHPHPLYGGNMVNPVVGTIAESYERKGYSTLRFNFRGVGGSQGSYDEGRGEVLDLMAAVSYLREKGIHRIDLAGYSFGAWVIAKIPTGASWGGRIVMVSPPVAAMDMPVSLQLPGLYLVITGELDDIAPAELIKKRLPGWNAAAQLEIIRGADHFYSQQRRKLQVILDDHL